jgi:hypothetical protein
MQFLCFLFQTWYLIALEEIVQFNHTVAVKSCRHDCYGSVQVLRLQLLGAALLLLPSLRIIVVNEF